LKATIRPEPREKHPHENVRCVLKWGCPLLAAGLARRQVGGLWAAYQGAERGRQGSDLRRPTGHVGARDRRRAHRPKHPDVLEVGTGDAKLLAVALDNGADRAAYVGPASSFSELASP
jgi:hypothetical protein